MNRDRAEIAKLCRDIEQNVGRKMVSPLDFEWLSGEVWERMHRTISPTTLKRLWGYINETKVVRHATLDLLARFIGFESWEAYVEHVKVHGETESEMVQGEGVNVKDLAVGDEIEVTWLPNRRCRFRYEGKNVFEVVAAEHAKLHVGGRFSAAFFIVGQPLYIDDLWQDDVQGVSYVAGERHGLSSVKKV